VWVLLFFGVAGSGFGGEAGERPAVGSFTTIIGEVLTLHDGASRHVAARLHDPVRFLDLIQTLPLSRARAWLRDDSVLTVAENSRVRVDEHLVDPSRDIRRVVVSLVEGRMRAYLGKVFSGAGSKFEVHTPTAVAAARGTDFVVWVEHADSEQWSRGSLTTGLANIGTHGDVMFSAENRAVLVRPGQFSVALPGLPPSSPAPIGMIAPVAVSRAIAGMTEGPSPHPGAPGLKLKAMPGNLGTIGANLANGNLNGIVRTPAIGIPPDLEYGQTGLLSVSSQKLTPQIAEIKLPPARLSTTPVTPAFPARR
jgi:hypothetical protein